MHPNISSKYVTESWDIVDRCKASSIVVAGPYAGETLEPLRMKQRAWMMGPHWPKERAFPILVKRLDCSKRLSLQVHPSEAIAQELRAESKNEFWYIAQAGPQTALIAGLSNCTSRSQFEQALRCNDLEASLHRLSVKAGDAMFVPSGRIHASSLVLEIERDADTTYRVHDWDRVELDGKLRAVHVEQSLRCIDFGDVRPTLILQAQIRSLLVDYPFLRLLVCI